MPRCLPGGYLLGTPCLLSFPASFQDFFFFVKAALLRVFFFKWRICSSQNTSKIVGNLYGDRGRTSGVERIFVEFDVFIILSPFPSHASPFSLLPIVANTRADEQVSQKGEKIKGMYETVLPFPRRNKRRQNGWSLFVTPDDVL